MKTYKLAVQRQTLMYEVWHVSATSAAEARELFNNGDADFQWQEETQESYDPEIQSVEALPGPDPDIDMDEGL